MMTISDDDVKSVLENPWAADDDCRVVELTITQEMSTCMYRELFKKFAANKVERLNVTFETSVLSSHRIATTPMAQIHV